MKKFLILMTITFAVIAGVISNAQLPSLIGLTDTDEINNSNADSIINDPLTGSMQINVADLNAKFKALSVKIKKTQCEVNEGSTYDDLTEQCLAPPSFDSKYMSFSPITTLMASDSSFVSSGYERPYMMSLWFRSSSTPATGQNHVIMATASNGMAIGWDDQCSVVLLNALSTTSSFSSNSVCDGQWHNLVLVSSDRSYGIFVYLDGSFVSSSNIGGNFLFRDGDFVLGGVESVYASVNGTSPNFDISHFDMWSASGVTTESLGNADSAKITEIYNNGEPIDANILTTVLNPIATLTFGDSSNDSSSEIENVVNSSTATFIMGSGNSLNK
jgi:hypothetical protein